MYAIFNYKQVPQKAISLTAPAMDTNDLLHTMGPVTPIPDNPIAETQVKIPKTVVETKTISTKIPEVVEKKT